MRFPRAGAGLDLRVVAGFVALYCLLVLSLPFWERLLEVRPLLTFGDGLRLLTFGLFAYCAILLFLLPLIVVPPLGAPLLALVLVAAALASYFGDAYGVLIDRVMIRNVLATDPGESAELLNGRLLVRVGLLGIVPALVVLLLPRARDGWRRATLRWLAAFGLAIAGVALAAALHYKDHAALLREHRELRQMLVPVNLLSAVGSYVHEETRRTLPHEPVGTDVKLGRSWAGASRARPRVVVLIVGETARAANFSLDGYARQTNPQLATIPGLVNFPDVTACGTSTAISVPCMFSGLGRAAFEPDRARARDNLLDIVARAGFEVRWYGNNTTCKGICKVAPQLRPDPAGHPDLCLPGRPCMDGAMFEDFERGFQSLGPRSLIVLHMLGSHGPGYHLRYPEAFGRFQPACRETDFSRCTVPELVNAYDNTLLYSDYLLARAIRFLEGMSDRVDSALLFVSDHGESLGEGGLFLHAMPYAIAPDVQLKVPMVFWASPGFSSRLGADPACVVRQRVLPRSHDHVFHSTLGLLDLETVARDPALDMFAACRQSVVNMATRPASGRGGG